MVRKLVFFYFLLCFQGIFAQSAFLPINHESEYFLDRIEIKTGRLSNEFHSGIKPFSREAIAKYLSSVNSGEYYDLSNVDRRNFDFIKSDNWEFFNEDSILANKQPLVGYLFRQKSDFIHYKNKDFNIHASPILYLYYGTNTAYGELAQRTISNNTRGVEIRGSINEKLGFYTMFADNITDPENYLINYFKQQKAFPYESFIKIKDQDSTLLHINYFQASGYFTFKPIKSLQLTFGHDKNFIGSGVRSLALSDFSVPFLQLRFDLRLGKFQYQNIFGQMTNLQVEKEPYDQSTHKSKFMAFHHLDVNVTDNINLGIFESVMFGKRQIGFDPNYLNPLIFFRFVEGYLGSSDNAMVGADFKWNLLKNIGLYGQFILDEFNKKEFRENLWWSKKYGYQLGLKYMDVFKVDNLDLQLEFNRVRPYTYSHFSAYSNFVNYNLPLAHPLGANFTEGLTILRYQPTQKLQLKLSGLYALKGMDKDSLNYGGDIKRINFYDRPYNYNVKQGQGFRNTIRFIEGRASYMFWHNIYADVLFRLRTDSYSKNQIEKTLSAGLRWNFQQRNYQL